MNFLDKRKVGIKDSGSKVKFFLTQQLGKKMIFRWFLRKLDDILRTEKNDTSVLIKR